MGKILSHLSVLLNGEIKSSNTYFMHYKILQSHGWFQLADQEKENHLDEMGHADKFIDRIFFLNGVPQFNLNKISPGTDINSILELDLKLEQEAVDNLKQAIGCALLEQDYGTFELLQTMLADEEAHVDRINTQISCLKTLGVKKYLQKYG
ncbi:MAG: bacterioferritin [Rickettsiaceae bacterium H1]|nr:bacterioferritin [Rickettsiaceae bacterium H1]